MKATLKLEDGKEISIELTEEQIEAIKPKKEYGRKCILWEKYWFNNNNWTIIWSWNDDSAIDGCRFNMWNYYKTLEEAEFASNRQFAITEINDRIDELNEGWVPDWSNSQQRKCCICCEDNLLGQAAVHSCNMQQILHYMKSKEIAEKIISEFKNNIETYIFKIK